MRCRPFLPMDAVAAPGADTQDGAGAGAAASKPVVQTHIDAATVSIPPKVHSTTPPAALAVCSPRVRGNLPSSPTDRPINTHPDPLCIKRPPISNFLLKLKTVSFLSPRALVPVTSSNLTMPLGWNPLSRKCSAEHPSSCSLLWMAIACVYSAMVRQGQGKLTP